MEAAGTEGPGAPTLAEKVAFLRAPASYPEGTRAVEARETRMSWVFLTDAFAYKLKKPVAARHLDFRSLALRRAYCEEEVRLNARLAPAVYLGTVALRRGPDGRLRLGGEGGEVVDWLVRMRRLPAGRMLDAAIRDGTAEPARIEAVADLLAAFYARAEPVDLARTEYLGRFLEDQATNREVLRDPAFGLPRDEVDQVLAPVDAMLRREPGPLLERLAARRIVEGHGDLRPEHVCLLEPPVVFDCIEFNQRLRIVDPAAELGFLAMECELLGAPQVGERVLERYAQRTGDHAPQAVVAYYKSRSASVRARLCLLRQRDGALGQRLEDQHRRAAGVDQRIHHRRGGIGAVSGETRGAADAQQRR